MGSKVPDPKPAGVIKPKPPAAPPKKVLPTLSLEEVSLDHNVKFKVVIENPGERIWGLVFTIDGGESRYCSAITDYIQERWNLSSSVAQSIISNAFDRLKVQFREREKEYLQQLETDNGIGALI